MQFPLILRTVKITQVHCVGKTNFLNGKGGGTRTCVLQTLKYSSQNVQEYKRERLRA